MRTRVKICGITRPEDALLAATLGADAVGLVFYAPSPRALSPSQATEIIRALPAFITVVGLFVNASAAEIETVLGAVRIDALQFHGNETPAECRRHGRPYIKAVAMREGIDLQRLTDEYHDAIGLLLDNYQAGSWGGTGQTFDWSRTPKDIGKSIILAGGLTSENVTQAIRLTQPFAVDVSSGVESTKGIKDAAKLAAFMGAVNNVNRD